MQTNWLVRVYFTGTGEIRRADGVVRVAADSEDEAKTKAIDVACRESIFQGMSVDRAKIINQGKVRP